MGKLVNPRQSFQPGPGLSHKRTPALLLNLFTPERKQKEVTEPTSRARKEQDSAPALSREAGNPDGRSGK